MNSSFIADLYIPVERSVSPSLAGRGQMKAHIQRTLLHRRCSEGVCRPELSSASFVGAHWTDASSSATITTTITTTAMAAAAPARTDEPECLFAEVMSSAVGLEVVTFVNAAVGIIEGLAVGMAVGVTVGLEVGVTVGLEVGVTVGLEVGLVVNVTVGAKVK